MIIGLGRNGLVLLALLLSGGGVLLVGCSRDHTTGVINGGIVYHGGPFGRDQDAFVPGEVEVIHEGRTVRTVSVGEGEEFSIRVAPGAYKIVAHSGDAGCAPDGVPVTVVADATQRVVLPCEIR